MKHDSLRGFKALRASLGFSLVEVTLALGVMSFVLVAFAGMLLVGENSGRDSMRRLGAAHSASQLFAQRRAIPAVSNMPVSATNSDAILPAIKTDEPETLTGTVYLDENNEKQSNFADALYRVDYRIQTAPAGRVAALRLRYSWPPGAQTGAAPDGKFEITTAILVK